MSLSVTGTISGRRNPRRLLLAHRPPFVPGALRARTTAVRALVTASAMAMALCVATIATPAALSAQEPTGTISGTIQTVHSHSLSLAEARIVELAQRVQVGEDGSFRFEKVRPGTYRLEVEVPGLGGATQQVVVRVGETTEVAIEVRPGRHFDEIVVSGGETRDSLELATPVSSLSGPELLLRQEASLGETLAQQPGISSSFFGPGASRPIIRGLGGDRVRVLEDGIDTGDASSVSNDHAVAADPAQAERIEVLRGPATLLFGSSAIGGAVNVIDERIPSSRAARPLSGTVDLRAGSGADERTGSFNLNGGRGSWAWHLDGVAREADDYEVPGFAVREEGDHEEEEHGEGDEHEEAAFGFVPNTDLSSRTARVGVTRFFGDRGYVGLAVGGFESEYGLPEGGHGHEEEGDDGAPEEEEEEEEAPVRIDLEQRRFDLRAAWTQPFAIFRAAKLRLGATDYEHTELEGTEAGTVFFNDFLESRLEFVQQRRGRLTGSMGLQFSERELEAIGEEAFIPKTDSQRWAIFAFEEVELGALRWQLGARYEAQEIDAVGQSSRSHDGLSASLGLVWDFAEPWSVAASLSRSVKVPVPEELFSNGLHVASQAFEVGDANLTEESGTGLDVSLRRTEGKVTGELTVFRQDFSDFIYQRLTGEEEEGFPVVLYSQADAEFTGAEASARIELLARGAHHLHLELMGDLVRAELDEGGNLPRIPPRRLGGGLHYHGEHVTAMTEVRWTDQQDRVAEAETSTPGYTVVNASVGYRFIIGERILDLLLRGRNLTDEEARSHTSFLKNIAPLPGRDVSLSLRFWF